MIDFGRFAALLLSVLSLDFFFYQSRDASYPPPSFSSPTADPPRLVHFVTMANTLEPYTIVAIDSAARHIPLATIRLHVITPEGADATVLNDIEDIFKHQLQRFLQHPAVNLEIVLHPDVVSELVGTPLEGIPNLSQKHFGGTLKYYFEEDQSDVERNRTPFGPYQNALVQSADTMRVLFLFREGGLYMDTDYLLVNSVWPLVQTTGNFVVCETSLKGGACKPCNGFFAGTKGGKFLWELLHDISALIKTFGIDSVYPLRTTSSPKLEWGSTGPLLLRKKVRSWIVKSKDIWTLPNDNTVPSRANRVRPPKLSAWYQTDDDDFSVFLSPHASPSHRSTNFIAQRGAPPSANAAAAAAVGAGEAPTYAAGTKTSRPTKAPPLGAPDVYLWPVTYFYPTSYLEHTMDKPLTVATVQMYSAAFGAHLGESFEDGGKIRAMYLDALMFNPHWALVHIHRQACWLHCDFEGLKELATDKVQKRLEEKAKGM